MRRRFFNNNIKNFDINDYLTIEALEDNLQVYFSNEDLMYGIDGLGWQKLIAGQYSPPINAGQTISFKGNVNSTILNLKSFTITKRCNLLGNCMSLTLNSVPHFSGLFQNCTTIVCISKDFLPATTLADYCYYYMFNGCNNLTTAPELPATTLADYCYYSMFDGCTNLTTAPELPATTLADSCYRWMFLNCTSLTTAPELPATTLADYCYYGMFDGCTSLTTAPKLPATTLATWCYSNMFQYCTGLTTAPELPATTLADYCYGYMFRKCTKLNYIKMLATDISASNCLYNWVNGVSSTGTFVKNPAMTTLPTGISGIPSGWTVVNDGEESGGNAIPNNQIHYTSIDNAIVYPYYKTGFGANIVSNTNENGLGIITFDGDITTFESYAYAEVKDLTSITIPNSVTLIEFNAFEWCTQLTSVTIGEGVTEIKTGAFYYCRSLSSVYCKAKTPPSIGNEAFGNNASGRKIYVPMESVDAYRVAEGWIDYANDIVGYNF